MIARHADYTCIGNLDLPYHTWKVMSGRAAVQKSSRDDWDEVWVGGNLATMVAGAAPYGNIENAALAVKGERIAWIGSAAEGRATAAAQNVPVRDAQG